MLTSYYKTGIIFILLKTTELAVIEESAEQLYGLIHARYILTRAGLEAMAEKLERSEFGTCPRYLCGRSRVLPVGMVDRPGHETVRIYCARCLDIFIPREVKSRTNRCQNKYASIDGAFFGTTFCHLFYLSYPNLIPRVGRFSLRRLLGVYLCSCVCV